MSGASLKNSKDIRENVRKLDQNQASILKEEAANKQELKNQAALITTLQNEQDKLVIDYKTAKKDHTSSVNSLEAQ